MRNEEQPTRRTRRSFLKKSAMAGVGAQSSLIFSGLVMASHASGSSCSPQKFTYLNFTYTEAASENGRDIKRLENRILDLLCVKVIQQRPSTQILIAVGTPPAPKPTAHTRKFRLQQNSRARWFLSKHNKATGVGQPLTKIQQ